MKTNTKIDGSTNPASEVNLDARFSGALDLVYQDRHDEAATALEALEAEAGKLGMVAMARSARTYLAAMRSCEKKKEEPALKPELDAQLCLNRGASDEALELLNEALKTQNQDARLFYLKATAHAQKDEAEPAAEAIRRAVSLNQDFLHQFRLERDFDRVRSSASFTALGLE